MFKYSIFIEKDDPTGNVDYIGDLVQFEIDVAPEDLTFEIVQDWFKNNTDYFEEIFLFGGMYKGWIEYIPYIEGY
jgi:hypothetical protein